MSFIFIIILQEVKIFPNDIFMLILVGCIWAAFGYTSFEDSKWQVIIVACLMGAGSTGMLGPCLTLIASMIGSNTGNIIAILK